jgi:hypothetical protein
MRTTLSVEGFPEMVLEKAVDVGLARSKADAVRLGILSLNREYSLVPDIEMAAVERKMRAEIAEMKRTGEKYLSEDEALKKYSKVRP